MTAEVRRLSAAVTGASGTGSIGIELAARLGSSRLVVIDPQHVERKNLNRIINATSEDAAAETKKVAVAKRAIEAMGFATHVDVYAHDLVDRQEIEAVAECDVIFGCVDSAEARDVLGRISTWYLLPYIDVGVGIVALPDGSIDQVNGVVHYIQPGRSSLLSRKAYRPDQVAAEAMRRANPSRYQELLKEEYIEGAVEEAPAVMSVNMTMALLAINEFLARVYGFRNQPNRQYASLRISLTEMSIEHFSEGEPCRAIFKYVGAGDTNPLLGLPKLGA